MDISKGWLLILGFLAGLWLGSKPEVGPEIQSFFAALQSSGGTVLEAAGEGAQDTGQFIRE